MSTKLTLLLSLLLCLPACKKEEKAKAAPPTAEPAPVADEPVPEEEPPPAAIGGFSEASVEFQPSSDSKVSGEATLVAKENATEITIKLSGLTPGEHGFHVHETGDCSAPDASSAGGHYNPEDKDHGAPGDAPHHAGDMGNLTADAEGNVDAKVTADFALGGPMSAVGRALIIHGDADDLKSQPSGNAGPRVACGVIVGKP